MRRINIRVLFFGATASAVGKRSVDLSVAEGSKSGNGFDEIINEFPKLTAHKLLYSLNQNYATGDEILSDGDELAIFTAVSGG